MLDTGEVKDKTQIARDNNACRTWVYELMGLLRLAPEIIEYIDALDGTEDWRHLSEPKLRAIAKLKDHAAQRMAFEKLVGVTIPARPPTSPLVAPPAARPTVGSQATEPGA